MEIALERCLLRDWRRSDDTSLALHANNKNVARYVGDAFPHPYTIDDARSWIKGHAGIDPPTSFAIVVDGAACGGIGVLIGSGIHRRSAELGYWLSETYWGRGIVTEAVGAVTRYAFATFDLEHIIAGVFPRNAGSQRVLEKAGFSLEARLRMHVTKFGETTDDLVYGITRADANVPRFQVGSGPS